MGPLGVRGCRGAIAALAAVTVTSACSIGSGDAGPLADTSSYRAQSESQVASCTTIPADAATSMLVTALHLGPDFEVPGGLTFTGVRASVSSEVTEVRPVLVLGSATLPGYSAIADGADDIGRDYVTVPVPAAYDGTELAGVGVIVDIRPDGPADPTEPIVDITGVEYTVAGRGDFVIPASRIQWVSRLDPGDDGFCAAYDLASLP